MSATVIQDNAQALDVVRLGAAAPYIVKSHERSTAAGIRRDERPDFAPLSRPNLDGAIEQHHSLWRHALPVMETLYEQIVNTHSMVVLTDAKGLILHSLGDDDFLARANRVALAPGVEWSEAARGTNAIGTAICEGAPTVVHADQHYLSVNHFLTCSATPIWDPHGNIAGVLDVTGDARSYHDHTLALVKMSAQLIENQLFHDAFPEAFRLHFHSRPEFIGTLFEGIAAFSEDGRFVAANRSGVFQLGVGANGLRAHTFSSLFGLPVSDLMDHAQRKPEDVLPLCLFNGVRVFAKLELRHAKRGAMQMMGGFFQGLREPANTSSAHVRAKTQTAEQPGTRPAANRFSSLHYLDTGDPQAHAVITKVSRVLGRDIPIMVTGETGTGKDLLAKAIHNDGPRAAGPFVAVNCASIPDTLIESELFGYEEGAFTGARRKGASGRIVQANGGTLFLDEIGDMPAHLQARLLRVLQERVVQPLGSDKTVPVDVMVICATNRNLRDMMAHGAFREDLYYRLNGLVVRLPALRERTDLAAIIKRVITNEAQSSHDIAIAPEVLELFMRYRWPGNFRQLTNLLRTALVMAEGERVLTRAHLPDDFLDEVGALGEPTHRADEHTQQPVTADVPTLDTTTVPTAQTSPHPTTAPSGRAVMPVRLDDMEMAAIRTALAQHQGNVSAAARALGVSRNTIYRRLQEHGAS